MINYFPFFIGLALWMVACSSPSASQPGVVEVVQKPSGETEIKRKLNGQLHGRNLSFYPNGNVQAILYYKMGRLHGTQRTFHPNGPVRAITPFRHDTVVGTAYEFYPNGKPAIIQQLFNGLRNGSYRRYYQSPWRLRQRAEYVLVNGYEHQNGTAEYDSTGRLLRRWGFVRLRADHDTLRLGQTLTLTVRLLHPERPRVLARVYGFDHQFRSVNQQDEVLVLGRGDSVTLRIQPIEAGADTVSGYIADYEAVIVPGKGKRNKERPAYFAYPYYVR